MTSSSRRQRSGIRLPLWGLSLLIVGVLLLLVISSAWLFKTVQEAAAQWEVTRPDFGAVAEPGLSANNSGAPAPSSPVESNSPQTAVSGEMLQAWSGHDRVTVLFLGIDQRCDEVGPTRTDSMMIATLDPVAQTAAVLSLPRDLWIEIPGFGIDRINQAHYLGEANNYPGGGGPALAVETVAAALGIPIDYYVTVNFDAFIEVIDLIGGIDIEVPEEIDDPNYPDSCYGYDPFQIDSGRHHLDGETALKYARTRATYGGDVDRAGRQQQVVLAAREKIARLGMLPQLIGQSPELWQTFQRNVRTDLSLEEAIQLALLVQEISRENIRTAVIDYDYVYDQTTPDGQQVLVPIRENIRALRDELFIPPAVPTPVLTNLPEKMRRENARVAVYNGTSTFGLAGDTRDYLEGFGVQVTEVGNADSSTYRSTQIIDFGSHPDTTLYLTQLLSVPPLNISNGTTPDGDYDVLIILGIGWEVPAN